MSGPTRAAGTTLQRVPAVVPTDKDPADGAVRVFGWILEHGTFEHALQSFLGFAGDLADFTYQVGILLQS